MLPDGGVVFASDDRTLRVWDAHSGSSVLAVEGLPSEVMELAVLPDGRVLSADRDRALRVWDLAAGRSVLTVAAPPLLDKLAVLPDGRVVFSCWTTLHVCNLESGSVVQLWKNVHTIRALAVWPDGRVVSASDKTLRVWDPDTGKLVFTLEGLTSGVEALAVLPDGRVLSGDDGFKLRVWDLDTRRSGRRGGRRRTLNAGLAIRGGKMILGRPREVSRVDAVAVLPDGRVVAALWGALAVWDVETAKPVLAFDAEHAISALAVLPDGRVVAASGRNLAVWDLDAGKPVLTVEEPHDAFVQAVAVLPGGEVVSASFDGTLRVWDLASGRVRLTLGPSRETHAVEVLPDGRVVSASHRDLLVWDLEAGKAVLRLEGHAKSVSSLAALADGRVVSTSDDLTLRLWDPCSKAPLASLTFDETPSALALFPDRCVVVVGDGSGHLHRIRPEEAPAQGEVAGDEAEHPEGRKAESQDPEEASLRHCSTRAGA